MTQVAHYIGAIDQGTTSTRFMVFDAGGQEVARHQIEHRQILSHPGWVEHDPLEILAHVNEAIAGALRTARITGRDLAAIGVTNQRETTVVWNPRDGLPWHNAIVWQDTRTDAAVAALEPARALIQERTGLPPASYFSAAKLQWILDNVSGVRVRAERGEALFGTIDSWIIWHLTGGADGGLHVTDATNASRTQLMNIRTREWDEELLALFRIPTTHAAPHSSLFRSIGIWSHASLRTVGAEVPIGGNLGDQHAAMVGQTCFAPGEAKNTYGTGNFMLLNTGSRIVRSTSRTDHDDCVRTRGRKTQRTRSRDRSPSPGPQCNGCATNSRSSEQLRKSKHWLRACRAVRVCISCRPSLDCSRRTGARMPVASSRA